MCDINFLPVRVHVVPSVFFLEFLMLELKQVAAVATYSPHTWG